MFSSPYLRCVQTVEPLARAREQSVLALWSGLGYYHRARRMHQAAKVIVRERHSIFPSTAEDWQQLPGIGRYTAAAIASIAATPSRHAQTRPANVSSMICGTNGITSLKVESAIPAAMQRNRSGEIIKMTSASARQSTTRISTEPSRPGI